MKMGSMMTWGHMLWIFFPIPLFCLLLLTVPSSVSEFEKSGTGLVGRIFFTRARGVRLAHVFIGASALIFFAASRTVQGGFDGLDVPPCSGTSCEATWYRRASRYRAERNFWLSLFTLVLWLLVFKIYELKEQIVVLRGGAGTTSLDKLKKEK